MSDVQDIQATLLENAKIMEVLENLVDHPCVCGATPEYFHKDWDGGGCSWGYLYIKCPSCQKGVLIQSDSYMGSGSTRPGRPSTWGLTGEDALFVVNTWIRHELLFVWDTFNSKTSIEPDAILRLRSLPFEVM